MKRGHSLRKLMDNVVVFLLFLVVCTFRAASPLASHNPHKVQVLTSQVVRNIETATVAHIFCS